MRKPFWAICGGLTMLVGVSTGFVLSQPPPQPFKVLSQFPFHRYYRSTGASSMPGGGWAQQSVDYYAIKQSGHLFERRLGETLKAEGLTKESRTADRVKWQTPDHRYHATLHFTFLSPAPPPRGTLGYLEVWQPRTLSWTERWGFFKQRYLRR